VPGLDSPPKSVPHLLFVFKVASAVQTSKEILFNCASKEMSDEIGEQFESTSSGASQTFPMQCSALRKNGFVVLKGFPCKVVEMSTSKTGKHGHAKVHLVGIDIFNGKKYEDICPSTHNMDVPVVTRNEFPLMDISDDGFCTMLLPDGGTKDDLKLPEGELGEKIKEEFNGGKELVVTVLGALGQEAIVAIKDNTTK